MSRLILFGPGYTGTRIAAALATRGWEVRTAGRADTPDLAWPTHIVSTVPPAEDVDPVLAAHDLAASSARWIGYLSSTGVYGDTGGAWVDESAPLIGRRGGRIEADLAWQAIGARVFRLPGIYGPGRSPLDRVRSGMAHRIDLPGQLFSRIHVDDIVSGVLAAIERGPAGVYNLADDLPASQNTVVEAACALLGITPPPLVALDDAGLSPAARAFYAENRRISAVKARRLLGWRPLHTTYREGLRALIATTSPTTTSRPPAAAASDQR